MALLKICKNAFKFFPCHTAYVVSICTFLKVDRVIGPSESAELLVF